MRVLRVVFCDLSLADLVVWARSTYVDPGWSIRRAQYLKSGGSDKWTSQARKSEHLWLITYSIINCYTYGSPTVL